MTLRRLLVVAAVLSVLGSAATYAEDNRNGSDGRTGDAARTAGNTSQSMDRGNQRPQASRYTTHRKTRHRAQPAHKRQTEHSGSEGRG